MLQLLLTFIPFGYAVYALKRLQRERRRDPIQLKSTTLKVQVGLQLQLIMIQAIELIVGVFMKELVASISCLGIIIGVFFSFGTTLLNDRDNWIVILPILFIVNAATNIGMMRMFDILGFLVSLLLVLYNCMRNEQECPNRFCQFFENEQSFFTQYVLLLRFQPYTYSNEIELETLTLDNQAVLIPKSNEYDFDSNCLPSQQTLQQQISVLDRQFRQPSQQHILSESALQASHTQSPQQQSIIIITPKIKQQPPQVVVPTQIEFDDQPFEMLPPPLLEPIRKSEKKIKTGKTTKVKNQSIITRKNRMMKRIRSYDEFTQSIGDQLNQSAGEASEFEKYKESINSSRLLDESVDSCEYVLSKLDRIVFKVDNRVIKKVIKSEMKHYISVTCELAGEEWNKQCLYGELYQISNGQLPKLQYTDNETQSRIGEVQDWLNSISNNPLLMTKSILEYFNVPSKQADKFELMQQIKEDTQILRRESNRQIPVQTIPDSLSCISKVEVECYNYEKSYAMEHVVYFYLKFKLYGKSGWAPVVSECNRTLEEIREASSVIKQSRGVQLKLMEHSTLGLQMKAIEQYLQELFNHQFYYSVELFQLFELETDKLYK